MSDRPGILIANDVGRRKGLGPLPPSSVLGLAPLLLASGFVLAIAGWVDVGLFYYPSKFGSPEWEFGTLAQTFDAMPLATLGLVMLALGVRARGGSVVWARGLALIFATIALLCVAALLLFALDIPLALKAMQHAASQANPQAPLLSSGLKRGIAKVIVFAVCYAIAYGWMAVNLWRVRREAGHAT